MWQQQLAFFQPRNDQEYRHWTIFSHLLISFRIFSSPDFHFPVPFPVPGIPVSRWLRRIFLKWKKTWESILRRLVDSRNWKMVVCGIRTEDTWMETNSRTTQLFTNVLCWGLGRSRPIGVDTRAQVSQILARISVFYCFEKIHFTGLLVSTNQQIFNWSKLSVRKAKRNWHFRCEMKMST